MRLFNGFDSSIESTKDHCWYVLLFTVVRSIQYKSSLRCTSHDYSTNTLRHLDLFQWLLCNMICNTVFYDFVFWVNICRHFWNVDKKEYASYNAFCKTCKPQILSDEKDNLQIASLSDLTSDINLKSSDFYIFLDMYNS